MRIDHIAYQRATRVAGFGLLLQLVIGLTLFTFSQVSRDTSMLFGSLAVILGSLAWISLIVIFYQHKLERLEALEEDELSQSRAAGSVFETAADEIRVAARRLRLMHKWLMPLASLGLAALIGFFAAMMLVHLNAIEETTATFYNTGLRGWAVAICLGFAAIGFIFSRFVAGMAKQREWQNLRGGAGFMVGNVLVLMALAVGIAFRYFENDSIIVIVAYAIPIFMIVAASEIVLNFILNLYRPRIPGEVPRPAFDSRLLSLLSAPDNLVRSINEAVNYQFGFDITSSWGYQLLLRSLTGLVTIGILVAILMNMIVVVEPQQQGMKVASGAVVGGDASEILEPGLHWKMPWPMQGVVIEDVTPVRSLPLTMTPFSNQLKGNLWWVELQTVEEIEPFLVQASTSVDRADLDSVLTADDASATRASLQYSLVDAEINLNYRIRNVATGGDGNGLYAFLNFASDERAPRERFTQREKLLRALALREVRSFFAGQKYDGVLAEDRSNVSSALHERFQRSFDENRTGIDVVSVTIPVLRPHSEAAQTFVDLAISKQAREQLVDEARGTVDQSLAYLVGSPEDARVLLEAIEDWKSLREDTSASPDTRAAKYAIARDLLLNSDGAAAQTVRSAENERWVKLMASRTEASRVSRELPAYRAAPRLYKERQIMNALMDTLSNPLVRKFVLGVDPSHMHVDIDRTDLDVLNFSDALNLDGSDTGGESQ